MIWELPGVFRPSKKFFSNVFSTFFSSVRNVFYTLVSRTYPSSKMVQKALKKKDTASKVTKGNRKAYVYYSSIFETTLNFSFTQI